VPLFIVGCVVVVGAVTGGRASDAVDDSTGVAIEEESAGEEGVAAAATPSPNPNRVRGGRETSFSFSFSFAGTCLTRAGIGDARMGSTMDVIGLIGTLLGDPVAAVGVPLGCTALELLAAGGRDAFACLGTCVGASVGVATGEPEPALALALKSAALEASAHIAATAVTRPPRPPRADLTPYFIST